MAGSRAANRAEIERRIREAGREQLSEFGAAGLSLRAVARELGMVSSAVYRYVASRDDLLTLLLVEAYDDLADAVDAARAGADSHRERIAASAAAMRAWAVADPARWAMLYGSPVPGYAAPPEATIGPGTRVVVLLLGDCAAAYRSGELRAPSVVPDQSLGAGLVEMATESGAGELPPAVVLAATVLWATVIGGIGLEVFGQYGSGGLGPDGALFAAQIDSALASLFGAASG